MKFKICNFSNATVYQEKILSSSAWGVNVCLSVTNCQPMNMKTLQMINNFNNEIHTRINKAQPVNFPGLPEDKQPLTHGFNVCLTNDQQDCYIILVSSAVRIEWYRQYYWANKNFENTKEVELDPWYYMGLSIETGSWNTLY